MINIISNLLILFPRENCYLIFKSVSFILSVSSLFYLVKIWRSYLFFQNLNIKTPTPIKFFYGNFREIQKEKYSETLRKWTNMYGKTYGYYEGSTT